MLLLLKFEQELGYTRMVAHGHVQTALFLKGSEATRSHTTES
jgi:hypothetical protein